MTKLNTKNIKMVRDAILNDPKNFDMSEWAGKPAEDGGECGTACCIGGWVNILFPDRKGGFVNHTAESFGISTQQSYDLCIPEMTDEGKNPYTATAVQGARVLDILIETGEVDWERALLEA